MTWEMKTQILIWMMTITMSGKGRIENGNTFSSKRTGNYTDSGAVAACKGGKWAAQDMAFRAGTRAGEGDLSELLFIT